MSASVLGRRNWTEAKKWPIGYNLPGSGADILNDMSASEYP